MSTARDLINDFITSEPIVLFIKNGCPYCTMAKTIFDDLKQAYQIVELDKRKDGEKLLDSLAEMTGARTVPRVFFKGVCLGGGTDVKKLYESGELKKMTDELDDGEFAESDES